MIDILRSQEEALIAIELLKVLASIIIEKNSYKIDYSEYHQTISSFFNKKGIDNIDSDELTNKLLHKKILIKLDNNSYAFGSFDFLAYFAAKHYSELIDDDFDKNIQIIDNLLNNCYDDVVSKLLLFLVSLANKKTALYLIGKAEKFVEKYDDYDVVHEEFALYDEEFKGLHKLTKKDRQILREKISEKESENHNKQQSGYKSSVDNEKNIITDEEIKTYSKGLGLLETVSSMLPDLKIIIDHDDQLRCVRIIYKLPLILLHMHIGIITDNFLESSEKLKSFLEENGKMISLNTAKKILVDECRALFLAYIDHATRKAHTRLTESDLSKKEFADNDTKKLIRLMSTIHDENAELTFEKYAKSYFDYFSTSPFARNCISLMVRNYVSWYLSEEKAITKRDFLKVFLKDEKQINETIMDGLKGDGKR